jgi:hypothetical protein
MIRLLFIGIVLIIGNVVPGAVLIVPVLMGSLLAYAGTERHVLWWGTLLLLATEAAFGADLGIFSLAFLGVALMLRAVSRFVAFTPWAAQEGWAPTDGIRAMATASTLAVLMIGGAVLVGAVYGHGAIGMRLASELAPSRLIVVPPLCVLVLVILRRMDIPFRKPIRFGQ